jgi:hypothetical protein
MDTPVCGIDAPDGLNFLTGFHTTTAFNAFAHVAYQCFAFYHRFAAIGIVMRIFKTAERRFTDVKVRRKFLQFATRVTYTAQTFLGMLRQNQLDDHFSDRGKAAVMGNDLYPFPYLVGAGGYKFSPAVTFHHADTAVGAFAQIGMFAEGGDMYISYSRRFQDSGTFWYRYRYAVNR